MPNSEENKVIGRGTKNIKQGVEKMFNDTYKYQTV